MIRRVGLFLAVVLALAGVPGAASATPVFPTTIDLPDGFQPEGITIGPGPVAYLGSLADGSIYRADLVTGRGRIVSTGPGTPSVGVKTDGRGLLYVAGGPAGDARVIDLRTGRVLASHQLTTTGFVNDVVLTPEGAYFTDSLNPVIYRMAGDTVETIPLTGDLVYQTGFNANGIERTPDGQGLLIVQSNTGKLFRVSYTGESRVVELADSLVNGDGLLLTGRTLYVVQNRQNTVTELKLDRGATRATVTDRLTDPRFDVPTTVAAFGNRLYLPNARFDTPPSPTNEYQIIAIRR